MIFHLKRYMDIDVLGAIFVDTYIYDTSKGKEIIETIGGSGLTIALGLHLLGHNVNFFGNIGNDEKGKYILEELKTYDFDTKNISIINGYTGSFIAKNDKMFSVKRGVNDFSLKINSSNLRNESLVLTSEIHVESINTALNLNYKNIFFDVGPRAFLLKNINFPDNIIKIGNINEHTLTKCNIIKLGEKGAKWDDLFINGNTTKLNYTIGAGDLFDTILIDNYLNGVNKIESLRKATNYAEKSCSLKGGFKIINFI
ncbi:PfkB family carbohydrate kinase [Helicovermis profundi]|uniref:Carbohydrate kinase PfkB domain-containing protein n=1 Tax=Helicovermis profundi TaxID=3065157 RepID=A0AAU9EU11_9FIRM|nr:hypothetical protein HLPR_08810 [Clostridia bacterium S502]